MLTAQNISHAFTGKTLFSNLNISIQSGDKVALVGRNGSGKSTLLNILSGVGVADTGTVVVSKLDRVALITQTLNTEQTIGQLVTGRLGRAWSEIQELPKVTSRLGLEDIDPSQQIGTLSGGQQLRLQLALALCNNPTILLIDEPTNHLDTAGRQWLVEFLRTFSGGYLIVSHDRWFLDQTVSMVYELEKCELQQYIGGYSKYESEKANRVAKQNLEYQYQQKYIKRLQHNIQWRKQEITKPGPKIHRDNDKIGRDAAKEKSDQVLSGRARAMETKLSQLHEVEKPMQKHSLILDFTKPKSKQHRVFKLEDVVVGFTDQLLIEDISVSVYSDDRIALLGENGSGKSVLVQTILGKIQQLAGEITTSSKIGYLTQHNDLNTASSPLKILQTTGINQTTARGVLDRLGYQQSQIHQSVKALSAGETVKLRLASMMLQDFDFLILDEPTNNLDFASVGVVERLLQECPVGYLLITHDQYMLDSLTLKIVWQITNKALKISNY